MPNVTDLQPDYKAAAEFLGGLPTESINVTALAPDFDKPIASHTYRRDAAGIAACEKFLQKYGTAGRNLYFNCNNLSVRLSKSKRKLPDGSEKLVYKAKEAEVREVVMAFVDMDPPKGTPQTDLPATKVAMIARAKAYMPAPTIIIDSGNGLGCFWILTKPIPVTSDNLLMLKGINKKLIEDLEGDPACVNLDHVMRVPFTINQPGANKRKAGRVPALASVVLDMVGIDGCEVKQFTSAHVDASATQAAVSGNEYAQIGSPPISAKVDLSRLEADLRALIEDGAPAGADRSKTVYGVAAALRRIGWSDGAIIHVLTNASYEISDHIFDQKQRKPEDQAARIILDMNAKKITAEPDDGETFDAETTRSERSEARRSGAGAARVPCLYQDDGRERLTEEESAAHQAKAEDLQAKYQFTEEECLAAKYNDAQAGDSGSGATAGVHQPTSTTPAETWFSIKRGFVYIGQQELFVRKSDGAMWKVPAFEKQFGYVRFGIPNPPASLTKYIFNLRPGYGLKTFDNFCFVPGAGENVNGSYNQFLPSKVVPAEGDTSTWDTHLEYLFPDEDDRNRVLDWMAWVYTHPTLHPNHALAVIGRTQGTGKSFLQRVLAKLLSSTAASPVSQKTLEAATRVGHYVPSWR